MSEALRLLIVGGYGAFGGRIVELLSLGERLTLIIAGRSLARAQAYCSAHQGTKATLVPAVFDRAGDLGAQFGALRPDTVIDASGPFQAYGEGGYRLIEAALAQGVNYLDLADGAEFVAGVPAFDEEARRKGLYVLSGVSSFPVLTAAVTRRLASGITKVSSIRGGIAPSPYAEVGENVFRAIASYAGKPIQRVGATGYPFAEHMTYTIAPPGAVPLNRRLFSLVDVPDLLLLAKLRPELQEVWMGAAPVPALLHRAFIALAWLVRLGVLGSLLPLAPLLRKAAKVLRWGEHRSGMFVEVEGIDEAQNPVRRSWHLIAEGDDGPYIPAMAVAAIIGKALAGLRPEAGARAALKDVELADYERLFASRAVTAGIRDEIAETAPLYARILNSAWRDLPPEIRAMHDVDKTSFAEGRASVERGQGWLARFAGAVVGFPQAATDIPVRVRFDVAEGRETWTRTFGEESFHSEQFAEAGSPGLICERFGPMTFIMALPLENGRLSLILRRWRAFGIPMPMFLCPRSIAHESVEEGRFRFHIEISHPLTGLIVRYRGFLVPKGIPLAGQMP